MTQVIELRDLRLRIAYFRSQNRNQENVLPQFRQGMLGEHTPRTIADFARNVVGVSDYSREAWQFTKVGYSDDYVALVEAAVGMQDSD